MLSLLSGLSDSSRPFLFLSAIFFLFVHFFRKDSFCLSLSIRIHSNTSHIYILFLTSLFYPFRIHLFLSDKFLAVRFIFLGFRSSGGH
ncbi:hypothetical protein GIB67_029228 [Kingdonia uniflora]|uniref:Uncharacterized protein n=1 Tax=Kingdonia uniflora TaxID=39325 RepID=A0A7J7NB20_9MAGN|nr:hypothetical protein GIB67_029228 [Kingdonia uniflora]